MLGKSKLYTKHISEVLQNDLEIVGAESVVYSKLFKSKAPMPNSFVISSFAFDDFLLYNKLTSPIVEILKEVRPFIYSTAKNASEKIANLIFTGQFSDGIKEQIENEYLKLANDGSFSFVSLESSHIIPYEFIPFEERNYKFLDIRSIDKILERIKYLWLSLFSISSIELRTNNYYKGDLSLAILVKRMVMSEISGKIYSIPPITEEKDHIEIHAYFGIEKPQKMQGENSDVYKVDIKNNKIVEKKIIPQKSMTVRKGSTDIATEPHLEVEISPQWQRKQKISDDKIIEISKKFLEIEQVYKKPIEISWGIQTGEWFVTDANDLKLKDPKSSMPLDSRISDIEEKYELAGQKTKTNKPKKPDLNQIEKEIENILSGNIVEKNDEKLIQSEINNFNKVLTLPRKKTRSVEEISHLYSEKNKLKTKLFLDITRLNSTELSQIEYFDGTYFDGTQIILKNDLLPEEVYRAKDLNSFMTLVSKYTLDITLGAKNSIDKPFIYQFSNFTTEEFRLISGKSDINNFTSDERFIANPPALQAEIMAIKKSREEYNSNNISMAFCPTRNLKNLEDLKKILTLNGIRRSENSQYFFDLSIPSMFFDLEDIPENLVDGVIVNFENLVRLSSFKEVLREIDLDVNMKILLNAFKIFRQKNLKTALILYDLETKYVEKILTLKPDILIFTQIPKLDIIKKIADFEKNNL